MAGNNPGGINQLGSDRVPYGDAKRMMELQSEAPMSGAPLAGPAINAPRSVRRHPASAAAPTSTAPVVPPQPPGPAQISPQAFATQAWQQIAAIPGASPLVQQYAARAAGAPIGG